MVSEIFNAPWLYAFVLFIIVCVLVQCFIFMRRAWRHALSLGITESQIKKTLVSGITISIMPTLPVLIVFLSLSPLLGSPLPWLRLSIIGSAHYETYAATTAIQALGEELVPGGYSIDGWIAAAWVMTVGGSACVLWSSLAIKPVSVLYEKIQQKMDMRIVYALGGGALAGIMSYVTVAYGLGKISTNGVIFGISFLCGAILVGVMRKFPEQKWLGEYLMTISMIVAMAAACIIF